MNGACAVSPKHPVTPLFRRNLIPRQPPSLRKLRDFHSFFPHNRNEFPPHRESEINPQNALPICLMSLHLKRGTATPAKSKPSAKPPTVKPDLYLKPRTAISPISLSMPGFPQLRVRNNAVSPQTTLSQFVSECRSSKSRCAFFVASVAAADIAIVYGAGSLLNLAASDEQLFTTAAILLSAAITAIFAIEGKMFANKFSPLGRFTLPHSMPDPFVSTMKFLQGRK